MDRELIKKEVNVRTGEIRYKEPDWVSYNNTSNYVKKDFIEGIREKQSFENKFFNFITEFQTNLRQNYNATFEELGRLLLLMTYARYRDIEAKKHYVYSDNNKKMSSKILSKIWRLDIQQTYNVKSTMKKKGLIGEDEKGLYIDDSIMIRGKVFPSEKRKLEYYVMYDKPIRDLYNVTTEYGKVDNAKVMGIFLSLIPFIKTSTVKKKKGKIGSNNKLVMSEWDEKLNQYKPISKSNLAKHLSISRTTLDRYLGILNVKSKEITGKYLIYEIKPSGINDLTKTSMFINPMYTYTEGTGTEHYNILENLLNEVERHLG